MTAAAVTVGDLPTASDCVCCRNGGVLPATNGTIDKATVLQCCRDCIAGLFLDGLAGWLFLFDTTEVRFR